MHRVDVIVFDGVAGADDTGPLQAGNGGYQGLLHIQGEAGGNAVGIAFLAIQSFRLHKNLMALPVGKTGDFILDGRAVACACAGDNSGKQGGAVQPGPDDVVGAFVGPGNVTGSLRQTRPLPSEAEARRGAVSLLNFHTGEVDAVGQQTRRGAGFKSPQFQTVGPQRVRKSFSRCVAQPAAGHVGQPHMDEAAQKCACGQQHVARDEGFAQGGGDALNSFAARRVFRHDIRHHILPDGQVGLGEQVALDRSSILLAVDLRPSRPYRRAFAAVEYPELDTRLVGPQAHLTPQCVDFAHQVALGQASNGRIA